MSGRVEARDLGKKYKLYDGHWRRLGEWATGGQYRGHREHWALRHLTFHVEGGEAVGVVGQNGAGKSTLLKLLVGTTRATEGEAAVDGRVSALLELGLGFHPEFTGRQNAMVALQMAGLDLAEAEQLLPAVADFSELGTYLDQPLRTYSSGMQMRLAFAVATVERPDLLIVDEALAVGDAYFQHKCVRRIRRFKELGTTMLFVSHDPTAVKTLCDRALLLDNGELIREGGAEAVLDYYNAMIARRAKEFSIEQLALGAARVQTRSGDGKARIESVTLAGATGVEARSFTTGERVELVLWLSFREPLPEYAVGFLIRDRLGNEVFGANTTVLNVATVPGRPGQRVEVRFAIDLALGYGYYALTVAVHSPAGHIHANHDWIDNAIAFQVVPDSAAGFAGVARLPVTAEVVASSEESA